MFVVDSLLDENDGDISPANLSLREAVELSNDNPLPDRIEFVPALLGGTIFQSEFGSFFLQPGTPADIRITDTVEIVGLGQSFLELDGSFAFADDTPVIEPGEPIPKARFFTIDDGDGTSDIEVTITDLRFQNSSEVTMVGASIMSVEDLTLERVTFLGNSTIGDGVGGGAIYQRYGDLTLDGVTLTGNRTAGVDADGAGLYALDTNVSIRNGSSLSCCGLALPAGAKERGRDVVSRPGRDIE